jgi:hypothetical protein
MSRRLWLATVWGLSLAAGGAVPALAGVDPLYVRMKIYETRLSKNSDCSNSITIFKTASPVYQDLLTNPVFGSGVLPMGTYNCIMIRFSDELQFAPVQSTGSNNVCIAGQEVTWDGAQHDAGPAEDPDGNPITLHDGEDIIWVYFSTTGNPDGSQALIRKGLLLTQPLQVNGDTSRTFIWDFHGQVLEKNILGTWECTVNSPTKSIR